MVAALPTDLREHVTGAYHDALTPVFLGLAPMMLAAAMVLLFVRERPIGTHPAEPVCELRTAEELAPRGGKS